jgi:hypothetical protein
VTKGSATQSEAFVHTAIILISKFVVKDTLNMYTLTGRTART